MPKTVWSGSGRLFVGQAASGRAVRVRVLGDKLQVDESIFRQADVRVTDRESGGYLRVELPDTSVLTINDPSMPALVQGKNGFGRGLKEIPRIRLTAYLMAASVVLILILTTYGMNMAVEAVLFIVPESLERRLGSGIMSQFVDESESNASVPDRQAMLEVALRTLRPYVAYEGALQVTLVEDDAIQNAFALPGGQILIFSGILRPMESEDELFGLLAHEVGHIAHRHSTRRLIRSGVLAFITSVLVGDATAASAVAVDTGAQLMQLSHSRDDEMEADEFARVALREMDLKANALGELLEKIAPSNEENGWLTFLSSHPSTRQRSLHDSLGPGSHSRKRSYMSTDQWRILIGEADCQCSATEERP